MLNLTLNLLSSAIVLALIVLLVPHMALEAPLNFLLSVLIVGLVNFLIRPMLIILRGSITLFELAIMSFVMNLLVINIASGLIDDFDLTTLSSAIFGGILMMFFQIIFDRYEGTRGKLVR